MLREIARHNDARIKVRDSELGGARFDIFLRKGTGEVENIVKGG